MSKEGDRKAAVQALYAADLSGGAPDVEDLSDRAASLTNAAWNERVMLDAKIQAAATGWRLERMPAVDRNILRLAAYELISLGVSTGIAVSEAVNLAKELSTEKSGAFINGVLGRLVTDHRGEDEGGQPEGGDSQPQDD